MAVVLIPVALGARAVRAVQSSILDRDAVRRVVALLVEAEEAVDAASPAVASARSALRVVDAFLVPRFHYDPIKKVFYEYVYPAFSPVDLGNSLRGFDVLFPCFGPCC